MKKLYFLCMLSSAWCQQPPYELSLHTTRKLNSDNSDDPISNHVLDSATGLNGTPLPDSVAEGFLTNLNTQTHQEQVTYNDGQHTITMNDLPFPANAFLHSLTFACRNSILCAVRFPNTDVIEAPTTVHKIKKSVLSKQFDNQNPVIANTEDLNNMRPDLMNSVQDFENLRHLNTGHDDPHKTKLVDCLIYDVEYNVRKEDNDAVFTCAITLVDDISVLTNDQTGQHQRLNIQNDETIVHSSFEDLHGDAIPLPIISYPHNPGKFFDIPQEVAQYTFSLRKIQDPQ
jgi:hypothetical protein